MKPETKLEDWIEWRERCTSINCSDPTRARLHGFGAKWLKIYALKYSPAIVGRKLDKTEIENELGTPDSHEKSIGGVDWEEQAWQRFEASMLTRRRTEEKEPSGVNKRYKDWLFDLLNTYVGEPIDILEKNAALCIRDVARKWLLDEGPTSTEGKDQPLMEADEDARLLEDIIKDATSWTPDATDYVEDAKLLADQVWPELDDRMRWAMLGIHREMSLANENLMAAANCRHSALYESSKAVKRQIQVRLGETKLPREIQTDFPEKAERLLEAVTLAVIEFLGQKSAEWALENHTSAAYLMEG